MYWQKMTTMDESHKTCRPKEWLTWSASTIASVTNNARYYLPSLLISCACSVIFKANY